MVRMRTMVRMCTMMNNCFYDIFFSLTSPSVQYVMTNHTIMVHYSHGFTTLRCEKSQNCSSVLYREQEDSHNPIQQQTFYSMRGRYSDHMIEVCDDSRVLHRCVIDSRTIENNMAEVLPNTVPNIYSEEVIRTFDQITNMHMWVLLDPPSLSHPNVQLPRVKISGVLIC